jgi:hypothetical protein
MAEYQDLRLAVAFIPMEMMGPTSNVMTLGEIPLHLLGLPRRMSGPRVTFPGRFENRVADGPLGTATSCAAGGRTPGPVWAHG